MFRFRFLSTVKKLVVAYPGVCKRAVVQCQLHQEHRKISRNHINRFQFSWRHDNNDITDDDVYELYRATDNSYETLLIKDFSK